MKLHHIRNIVAIADRGSLRAAAKHLHLAQPAMSRSIRELEEQLGVTLFERNRQGMKLTPVGDLFVRRARVVQAELDRTRDEIEHFKGTDFGSLTVAYSGATMLTLLPKMIPAFIGRFPNIRVKVLEGALPSVETSLRDGLVDLYYGPVPAKFTDAALTITPLIENEYIVMARRHHPLSKATSLRELVGAPWLSAPVIIDADTEVDMFFRTAGLPKPHIAVQAASTLSITTTIAATDLLALLPVQMSALIDLGHPLIKIPIKEKLRAPRLCVLRRAHLPLTPAGEHMYELGLQAVTALRGRPSNRNARPAVSKGPTPRRAIPNR